MTVTHTMPASRIDQLLTKRRGALDALNTPSVCSMPGVDQHLVGIVATTEREIAAAPLEAVDDVLAAASVLAEMVLVGPAADDRDVALAHNLMMAIGRLSAEPATRH